MTRRKPTQPPSESMQGYRQPTVTDESRSSPATGQESAETEADEAGVDPQLTVGPGWSGITPTEHTSDARTNEVTGASTPTIPLVDSEGEESSSIAVNELLVVPVERMPLQMQPNAASDSFTGASTHAPTGGDIELPKTYEELSSRYKALLAWGKMVTSSMTVAKGAVETELKKHTEEGETWKAKYETLRTELSQARSAPSTQSSQDETDLLSENGRLKEQIAETKAMYPELMSAIGEAKALAIRTEEARLVAVETGDRTMSSLAAAEAERDAKQTVIDALTDKLDKVRFELNDLKAKTGSQ